MEEDRRDKHEAGLQHPLCLTNPVISPQALWSDVGVAVHQGYAEHQIALWNGMKPRQTTQNWTWKGLAPSPPELHMLAIVFRNMFYVTSLLGIVVLKDVFVFPIIRSCQY